MSTRFGHFDGTRPWRRGNIGPAGPVCCVRHGRSLHPTAPSLCIIWHPRNGAQLDQLVLDRSTAVRMACWNAVNVRVHRVRGASGLRSRTAAVCAVTADLAPLIAEHRLHSHLYADDTQIYGWCQPTDVSLLQDNTSACFDDVWRWMNIRLLTRK